jgi:translation initiation factor IF-3
VDPNGAQVGIRPLPEALGMARELGLDLVEVADKADPPVARIMDYGKYKYELAQRAKESKRKASQVQVKEMKYRPKISSGDFDTKTKKVEKFLAEGNRVKLTIMFRGRETQHPELGKRILDRVAEVVAHVGKVEMVPRLDGRNMTMVLVPDQTKKPRKPQAPTTEATAAATPAAPTEAAAEPVSTTEAAAQTEG